MWLAVALIAVVLIPSALGGITYVWCAPMARAMLRSCCPASTHAHELAVEQPCCEGQRVAPMTAFTLDVAPDLWIAPAPLVALIALALLLQGGLRRGPALAWASARRARAGPAPPLFLLHCHLRN